MLYDMMPLLLNPSLMIPSNIILKDGQTMPWIKVCFDKMCLNFLKEIPICQKSAPNGKAFNQNDSIKS